ncbi:MAG: polysaccharide biosynthesis tyrosine autokinase [Sedimentisphaerales bacterium]|nr:polysaccharide biosynthesis tyrosine autokinase [Sedimentisphaerales bacterium]
MVDSYITYNATTKRSSAAEVLKILQKEKAKRDLELSDKYQEILSFKEANSALLLEDERGNIMIQGLTRLQDALTEARIGTINAKANYEAAKLMSNDPVKLRQLIETQFSRGVYYTLNQEETQLRTQLNQLQLQQANLRQKLTSDHTAIGTLQSQIDQIQAKLDQMNQASAEAYLEVVRQYWLATKQKEEELQTAVDDQFQQAKELSTKASYYAILLSEKNRIENLCEILDDRIKEINVTEDAGALNISILEVARAADKPSKPQKTRIMALALVLGLLLGVGLALLVDWRDNRLRSADEVTAVLGVPVLGTVPSIKGSGDVAVCGRHVSNDPMSHIAESYKTIRTAVYFGVPEGQAKTILITSPAPGDGKSTLTSNLATAMAQADQKTLIIDADFRKPMQHNIFDINQKPGISDLLAGFGRLEDIIQSTSQPNLDLMPCGSIPVNPSEILNSQAFSKLLERLCRSYDRILIDSPPVMPVADARVLGALTDVTVVVLRADKSTRKASQQARDGLLSVGARILGAVVNDVNPRRDRYGYSYSGYGYGYGYGQRSRSKKKPSVDQESSSPEREKEKVI